MVVPVVVLVVRFSDLPYVAQPTGGTTLACHRCFGRSLAVACTWMFLTIFVVGWSDVVFTDRPCTCYITGGQSDSENALPA